MASASLSTKDMEAWQLRLDSRFPHCEMLRTDQVAKALCCDLKTVYRLFDQDGRENKPWLMGIEFNASGGANMARRIPRENAILFWARSANHRPDDFLSMLIDVIDSLHPKERLLVQQRINELNRR